MPQTVEVRFKGTRKAYFTWADDNEPLHLNEAVLVEAERGKDFGRVTAVGDCGEPQVRVMPELCGGYRGGRLTARWRRASQVGASPRHHR
jgi:hypothetical protein